MRRTDTEREFTDFAHAYGSRLLRAAEFLAKDLQSAEDLVQATLTKVFVAWPKAKKQNPYAYARRILINEHIDTWRRRRWRETLTAAPPDTTFSGEVDLTVWLSDRDFLIKALGQVTPRERVVLVLRYCEDLPEKEVAKELEISVGTVKSTASRALNKLRTQAIAEREAQIHADS